VEMRKRYVKLEEQMKGNDSMRTYKTIIAAIKQDQKEFKAHDIKFFELDLSTDPDDNEFDVWYCKYIYNGNVYSLEGCQFDTEDEFVEKLKHEGNTPKGFEYKKTFILDADVEDPVVIENSISISYNLLGRLLGYPSKYNDFTDVEEIDKKVKEGLVKQIKAGETIRLIDYITDSSVDMSGVKTKKEIDKILSQGYTLDSYDRISYDEKRYNQLTYPAHRAGAALIAVDIFDNVQKEHVGTKYFLMGFDDGQYFGVELPATFNGKTLKAAYKALQPPEVQKAKDWERQGEWFFVPLDKMPEVKPHMIRMNPRSCCTDSAGLAFRLPVDDEYSNWHEICCRDLIIGRDEYYVLTPMACDHSEHDVIEFLEPEKWVAVYKNTAVQSLSQNGVD
jgi:hypothetical protein